MKSLASGKELQPAMPRVYVAGDSSFIISSCELLHTLIHR